MPFWHVVTGVLAGVSWLAFYFVVVAAPLPKSGDPRSQYEWYHALAYPVLVILALAAVAVSESPWVARMSF